ncbi:MAG: hypothetical protein IPL55_12165 [Saprospiraceae bacterium]|nr:hypothetical protein [Saprospiraceae bacterium]
MIRTLLFSVFLAMILSSCFEIDENILPVVGIYRAHIIGVAGPFDLIISTDKGDNVIIEAPFDGDYWYTIKADIDNQTERVMDFNIFNQQVDKDVNIKGNGFFINGTIELRYTMKFDNETVNFKLVGTKI